jgi:hypothetical protein
MTGRWFAAFALSFIAAIAHAQGSDKEYVIAVNVDSTDWRIQQMMLELGEEAAKAVEQSAKNVHASIVIGAPSTASSRHAKSRRTICSLSTCYSSRRWLPHRTANSDAGLQPPQTSQSSAESRPE